jgi:CNT family concentrative nucleoside transporter
MHIVSYFAEYNRYLNLLGIGVVFVVAFCFSRYKKQIPYRLVGSALALQALLAFCILKTTVGKVVIGSIARGINYLYDYAGFGISFVFGALADNVGTSWGTIFAAKILPIIIFFGAFMAILFHFGIVQKIIAGLGYMVRPVLGTTGAETLCAVANSFLGQTESPLLIRNYLETMTKSELFVVMVSGMGTISGSILAVYASMGVPIEHLLASSVIAIPATILIAKILIPETEKKTSDDVAVAMNVQETRGNVFEAISAGTSDGLSLALNVGAMLIAFISLIALLNGILEGSCYQLNTWFSLSLPRINLDYIFSKLFYPFAMLLGFGGQDASSVAQLLGTKVAVNEFVAYYKMVGMQLPERVQTLTTYALCGFSNFSSIGIQVGGIGVLVPSKRKWLTELGLAAVFGGALSNLLTALVVGLFI